LCGHFEVQRYLLLTASGYKGRVGEEELCSDFGQTTRLVGNATLSQQHQYSSHTIEAEVPLQWPNRLDQLSSSHHHLRFSFDYCPMNPSKMTLYVITTSSLSEDVSINHVKASRNHLWIPDEFYSAPLRNAYCRALVLIVSTQHFNTWKLIGYFYFAMCSPLLKFCACHHEQVKDGRTGNRIVTWHTSLMIHYRRD
jgi:hypothetical protein